MAAESLDAITVGGRVELHPATDAWAMGDRYGEVVRLARGLVFVRMDKSDKVRKVQPENILRAV